MHDHGRDSYLGYVLGDVVDRGAAGIQILRELMDMPNCKMLLGNHEYMMLAALGEPYEPQAIMGRAPEQVVAHWYRNGGDVTHRAWKHLRKTTRADILDFLKALPANLDVTAGGTRFRLAHAAPVDLYPQARYFPKYREVSPTYFAVWDRQVAPQIQLSGEYFLIFGHTPTEEFQSDDPLKIWRREGRMCIDCGSSFPDRTSPLCPRQGRLACVRLEDLTPFYSLEPGGGSPSAP